MTAVMLIILMQAGRAAYAFRYYCSASCSWDACATATVNILRCSTRMPFVCVCIGQSESCSDIPDSAVAFHAGSKASVVPPHTPGDEMPTPLTVGPGVITSEYAPTQ